MYIRFESGFRDAEARCNSGIFCAAFDILYNRPGLHFLWQVAELRQEINWFNAQLDAPARFSYRPGARGAISGVCWFRDQACVHIARARYIAWLLNDIGVPVTERHSSSPGRILWEDNYQIVASAHLAN